ncbi:LysM peptidoglycan-binding domain-containing protein [Pontibacter harenae]|uniref:LysM peptidoglycan-binding domain-containing protein n=1 Tax=Pontibacter harenae TaxID=2894083 RepID=UPI001E5C4B00|nr:LysM peptidoglycan-binding domain-containing protein [Pontibacter harenae]MCC9167795.1 LysM peptidoglycan-binding domain-containing protein [Pontibacter harenae]
MGLFDFLKKGKEEPAKPTSNVPSSKNVQTPKGTQPISKGTDMTSRQPGKPEQGFYSEKDMQQAPVTPTANQQEYTVASGDSLSKIAQKLYGNANEWNKIYNANKDRIGDNPDLIRPGQRIIIPRD